MQEDFHFKPRLTDVSNGEGARAAVLLAKELLAPEYCILVSRPSTQFLTEVTISYG
jgi:hypothetical protein